MAKLATPSPVFIVGTLRSGASLLSLALSQHATVQPVMENPWLEEFFRGLVLSYRAASKYRATSQVDIQGIELETFISHFGASALSMMSTQGSTSPIVLDSTPANLFLIGPLRLLFPRARLIHVVRDVREVVASLTTPDLRLVYKSRHLECAPDAAYAHWLSGISTGIEAERAFGSDVVLRLRRQNLLAQPEQVLQRCCEFLELDYDPALLRPFSSVAGIPHQTPARSGRVNEQTLSTANALNAVVMNDSTPFTGDLDAVDHLNADIWRKVTRGERLVPPPPGSANANRQPREKVTQTPQTASGTVRRIERFLARLQAGSTVR